MKSKTILLALVVAGALHLTATLNPAEGIVVFAGNSHEAQRLAEQYQELAEEHFLKKKAGVDKEKLDDSEKRLWDLEKKLLSKQGVVRLDVPPDLYVTDLRRIKNEALERMNRNKLYCRSCKVRSDRGALVFENAFEWGPLLTKEDEEKLNKKINKECEELRKKGKPCGLPPPTRGGCPPGYMWSFQPLGQGCVRERR